MLYDNVDSDVIETALLIQKTLIEHDSRHLLKREYQYLYNKRDLNGFCYIACEALYHLIAKEKGWKPYNVKIGNVSHWVLIKDETILEMVLPNEGLLFDTSSRYYTKGRKRSFLTRNPSKRTMSLLSMISNCEEVVN